MGKMVLLVTAPACDSHLSSSATERRSRHRHRASGTVRHAAQVDGQASRLSSSGGSGCGTGSAAAARLGARPAGSGEDDTDAAHAPATAAVEAGRESAVADDELSQLKQDSAPITPLGLSGGEYIRAAACFRLFPAPAPPARKLMPVASEMILAHSAASSCDVARRLVQGSQRNDKNRSDFCNGIVLR